MSNGTNLAALVAWSGFGLAFIFGFVASKTNFCTMGAVSDIVNMGNWGRMRAWLLAIAIAIIGANTLLLLGLVDLSKSIYQRPNMAWLSIIVGGLCFGVGMTLASGCASKTLMRIGGGSLRSLVVFVFLGISSYMTLKGLFGQWRADFLDPVVFNFSTLGATGQDLPSLLIKALGTDKKTAILASVAVISGALLIFVFKDARFRKSLNNILAGVVIGLLVTAAWYVTGHIGYAENPDTLETVFFGTNTRAAESFSFVAPIAYSLELLMLWTDKSLIVTFGIASAVGVILGSLVYALVSKSFRWEGFASVRDTRNHVIGGILMGFGGVLSLGCTVGQGVSGLSTIALGSFLAFLSIVTGASATMKYMYWREMQE